MEYQVKGSSIRSKLDYVEEFFGDGARQALVDSIDSEDLGRILDSSWYPFAVYVEVLKILVESHFGGSTSKLQLVGKYSAEKALATTYKAFRASDSYPRFLGRISSLHHMLYNSGQSEIAIGDDERSCEIRLTGKPDLAVEDLHVALGFYLGCGLDYGHSSIRGNFSIEREEAHFRIDW